MHLAPKILHNHCFQFLQVLQSSQEKSKTMDMQTLGGKYGILWPIREWWITRFFYHFPGFKVNI